MMNYRAVKSGLATALFAGGTLLLAPGLASASVHSHSFTHNQQALEAQLASRVNQLVRLGGDVTAAKSLTPAHVITLTANIGTASTNINVLVAKVPTDTTQAQLNVDKASMLKQNRVFAVLTPQVFQTIEADAISVEVTALQGEEAGLLSAVNGLVGQHGYNNALSHYSAFVKLVNAASLNATNVAASALAQVPADYPGDTHLFVRSNKKLLTADIDLAHANYDASVIGLASGGYTGA
jgi:hypothetical protein